MILGQVQEDYEVIGHCGGKAVVWNEFGALFYMQGTEQEAPAGTVVCREYLMPVQSLPIEEQNQIAELLLAGKGEKGDGKKETGMEGSRTGKRSVQQG